ncbi:MAG: pyridoxamine 5'-phosphate oxidase family protein [Chloroflexota bacterium]
MPDTPNLPVSADDAVVELLGLRLTATLGTANGDGSLLLTPIWYLYENGRLYLPTGSKSHKVRNIRARPGVTVMVDQRQPTSHRWASASGTAEIVGGDDAVALNARARARYLTDAGEAVYGQHLAVADDVTIVVTPTHWRSWLGGTPTRMAREHGVTEDDVAGWFTAWE